MDNLLIILSLIFSGFLLFYSGDLLVENAKKLGLYFKIDPMVIGLTIVAFGTSAPELFVSVQGALLGQSEISIGNVVGSNITNVLLILGLSAVISPIFISKRTIHRDIPIMVGISVLFLILSLDLFISRIDGLILFSLLLAFISNEIRTSKSNKNDANKDFEDIDKSTFSTPKKMSLLILASLIGLMIGSSLMIYGASGIARYFGISELVIGLTIVALGTSLPEVVTSCIAAKKGESDIAIGNVIGSNIFNILGVMGIATILKPLPIPLAALSFDIPIMIFSAVVCLPIALTDRKISKGEGLILLGLYVSYVSYLILIAKEHASIPVVSEQTLAFIIPLSVFYYINSKKSNSKLN